MSFYQKCPDLLKNATKITLFDEKFITRESICGHFRPGGLGWGHIWGRLFEKMLVFSRVDFSKMIFFAIGVPVGDLGAKIAAKFSQQRFLGAIF